MQSCFPALTCDDLGLLHLHGPDLDPRIFQLIFPFSVDGEEDRAAGEHLAEVKTPL